jgi:hypothetical protein
MPIRRLTASILLKQLADKMSTHRRPTADIYRNPVGYNGKGTPGAGTSRLAIRKIMSLSLDNQVFPIEGKGEKQSKKKSHSRKMRLCASRRCLSLTNLPKPHPV